MSMMILTSESSGAPTLNGVNGALTAVLRWALVQNGWAVEYGPTGNAAVFRAGTGNRYRLHVNHDSAVSGSAGLATVRGCENASAAATLVDPFPTVAQVSNAMATWGVSTLATSTARRYKIFLWPAFFFIFIDIAGDGAWEPYFFGDLEGARDEDTYHTVVACRHNTNLPSSASQKFGYQLSTYSWITNLSTSNCKLYWCRDISGAVKSTVGCAGGSGAHLGQPSTSTFAVAAFGGYANRIEREKVSAHCSGASAFNTVGQMLQVRRGWFPNLWSGLHASYAGVLSEDVFSDTEYDPAASFMALAIYANFVVFMETTETWSPPSG